MFFSFGGGYRADVKPSSRRGSEEEHAEIDASLAVGPIHRDLLNEILDRRRGVGHAEAMIVGLAEGNAVQFLVHAHNFFLAD
jgi:hypothetical protein